ncbi:MAG TPA: MBOAT family O-acyltransferase [Leptospiraceae bacterium]|nr:MBOAT family O-acyltransferase [Leptospiraceae bacterium]
MLFNSGIFILLFFAVYSFYWLLPVRAKQYMIIITSILFYGWYSVPFLIMFLALLIINYYVGMSLIDKKNKKVLIFGIVVDVMVLVIFKYFYLLAETVGHITGSAYLIDLRNSWVADYKFEIILPIGISFYTFQVIAFITDCYTGMIREKVTPMKFYVFTLFFPHFVAGPIMRAPDLIPQIDNPSIDRTRMLNACLLILMGIVKKVLIADRLGAATSAIWHNPEKYDAIFLLLIPFVWAFQIYGDFSGYTDMARGIAKLLGFHIPENFRGPFVARSYQELWQRWHMTLSFWLRDYIYIPLGGSRVTPFRTYMNLMITFAVGGLWHGAAYNTIVWGLYTGLVLSLERMWGFSRFRLLPEGRFNFLRILYTYVVFSIGCLIFASPSMHHTFAIIKGVLSWQRGIPGGAIETLIGLSVLGYAMNVFQYYPVFREWISARPRFSTAMVIVLTFSIGLLVNLYGDVTGSFIYFKF